MKISDLKGKKAAIIGFGKEGQAALAAIEKAGVNCEVTVCDKNEKLSFDSAQDKNEKYLSQTGDSYLDNLDKFEVIIKSPGVPLLPELEAVKDKITSGTEIFLNTVNEIGSVVIGITGTKGKSTVSSLIYAVLKTAGKDVYLIGNIGNPALDYLDKAKKETIFVMELSSYQLADLKLSPKIAVVTSFFPDHLDYHGSLENYKQAKMNITRYQTEEDYVFFDATSKGAAEIASLSPGIKAACSEVDSVVRLDETQLIGQHNLRNLALVSVVAENFQIPKETTRAAIINFIPLPHRLQSLGVHAGIEWVDDAISTTPESTIAGLEALGSRVKTIILGGQDRGYDFSVLTDVIKKASIENVIIIGESGPRIKKALDKSKTSAKINQAKNMKEIVETAKRVTKKEKQKNNQSDEEHIPIVLLSTASPSYDMFKNFEEKGDEFKKVIIQESRMK